MTPSRGSAHQIDASEPHRHPPPHLSGEHGGRGEEGGKQSSVDPIATHSLRGIRAVLTGDGCLIGGGRMRYWSTDFEFGMLHGSGKVRLQEGRKAMTDWAAKWWHYTTKQWGSGHSVHENVAHSIHGGTQYM